jgi:hypothetical protein
MLDIQFVANLLKNPSHRPQTDHRRPEAVAVDDQKVDQEDEEGEGDKRAQGGQRGGGEQ